MPLAEWFRCRAATSVTGVQFTHGTPKFMKKELTDEEKLGMRVSSWCSRIKKRDDGRFILTLEGTNDGIYSFFMTKENLENLVKQIAGVV